MEKIRNLLDQFVLYLVQKNTSNKKMDLSVYKVFEQVQLQSISDLESENTETIETQLEGTKPPIKKSVQYWTYLVQNLFEPLYVFTQNNYVKGETIKGVVRGANKIEAAENAVKIYGLTNTPEKVTEVYTKSDRILDKLKVNPRFLFKEKVNKGELATFLIEYSSLMEDGLDKKDAIDIMKMDLIKDKGLLEFMEQLKTSNYKMSVLMDKSQLFDDYTVSIVESSEFSGGDTKLYEGISQLGESYRAEYEFKQKFIKSLYYPATLLSLLLIIILAGIFFVVPVLVGLFTEIVGPKKIPEFMVYLMNFTQNVTPLIIKGVFIAVIFMIVKSILLSNSMILGYYEKSKLKIPLIGPILKTLEENRVFRILIQTITSNLNEVQKIQSFEKSTSSVYYKGVYRTMRNIYPSIRNMTLTIEEANNRFGGEVFGKRMITMLNLAQGDSKKILKKYQTFLDKNTELLYERFKKLNLVMTVTITVIIGLAIAVTFGSMTSMVISLAQR